MSDTPPLQARFRVHPERGRRDYFTVFVFRDKAAMYTFWREQNRLHGITGRVATREDWAAITRTWKVLRQVRGRWRAGHSLGAICFNAKELGGGIVSHEMTHAAIGWAARRLPARARVFYRFGKGDRESSPTEERFCHAQGRLVAQFWTRYYRAIGKESVLRRVAQ